MDVYRDVGRSAIAHWATGLKRQDIDLDWMRQMKNEQRSTAQAMISWKSLIARTVAVGAIVGVFVGGAVFVGVKFAAADPGGPVTPNALTFAGVLRERVDAGTTTLTFIFRKGTTTVCVAPSRSFMVDGNGAFSVQVPLDACADGGALFDGATVVYDVRLGGATGDLLTPVEGVPISPVPYARFADQVGVNNDCPSGYSLTSDPTLPAGAILCRRGVDEVVRVGRGATAFWIDRYEASVWSSITAIPGADLQFGAGTTDDYPAAFPDNGQWTTPLYAVSRAGMTPEITPSRNITWFQAAAACAASGKRLPTGHEWLQAARGTFDPPVGYNGPGGQCNTLGVGVRANGRAARPDIVGGLSPSRFCVSAAGSENMIGNLAEWTDEWHMGVGRAAFGTTPGAIVGPGTNPETNAGGATAFPGDRRDSAGWPTVGGLYSGDGTRNVSSAAYPGGGDYRFGIPSAVNRGGHWSNGPEAGIFHVSVELSPTAYGPEVGFRCVIPR